MKMTKRELREKESQKGKQPRFRMLGPNGEHLGWISRPTLEQAKEAMSGFDYQIEFHESDQ
jgi:hypothetical protein